MLIRTSCVELTLDVHAHIKRWTAALHNFSQVRESETNAASDAIKPGNTGSEDAPAAVGGAVAPSTSEQLISSKKANELVEVLSQMTMVGLLRLRVLYKC